MPAANDACHVVERKICAVRCELPLEGARDRVLVHREDDHPVVGEQALRDRVTEPEFMEDRTIRRHIGQG